MTAPLGSFTKLCSGNDTIHLPNCPGGGAEQPELDRPTPSKKWSGPRGTLHTHYRATSGRSHRQNPHFARRSRLWTSTPEVLWITTILATAESPSPATERVEVVGTSCYTKPDSRPDGRGSGKPQSFSTKASVSVMDTVFCRAVLWIDWHA